MSLVGAARTAQKRLIGAGVTGACQMQRHGFSSHPVNPNLVGCKTCVEIVDNTHAKMSNYFDNKSRAMC